MAMMHPCQPCGACCAAFRVSFYWSEAAERGLPDSLTGQLNPWLGRMNGTNQSSPRCQALQGEVGRETCCNVYSQRPSPCREVEPGDEKCRTARARHGMGPLNLPDGQPQGSGHAEI